MATGATGLQVELPVKTLGYGMHSATLQGRSASASKIATVCSTNACSSPSHLEAMTLGINDASEGRARLSTAPGNKNQSPMSQPARRRAGSTSSLVHVHKLSLRSFKELEEQQSSLPNVQHPPSIYRRQRSSSLSSVSTSASTSGRRDASSPACSSRPSSRLPSKEEFPKVVRPLSGSEREQRKQETEDWFRAVRDINNSGRSLEEADSLLASARSRRTTSDSFGIGFSSRSASKTRQVSPTAEVTKEVVDENKASLGCVAAPRLCVDPVALWSAKAEAAAAKIKLAAAPTAAHGARRMHTINGEGIAFGPEGANSLRSRLSRRIINSEQI